MRTILMLAAAAGLIGAADHAHATSTTALQETASAGPTFKVPFHVGEKLTYQAKVNFINAGSASMSVEGIETIRGHATYHTVFDVRGRLLFFHVNDFYPERKVYVRNGVENPSVADPLDEGSFIYFMRSVPLEVGKSYQFNRYYHLDRNPVIINVERREHISVPAGEFDAIVVRPIIKSKGLFSENGDAEVWFSDDSTRTLLRLKSKLPVGTLYLELKQAENTPRG
jgi:hypothetical protein